MTFIVLPEAADEFEDAADYYDQQQPGLGQRFRDEVDGHIHWIAMHPELLRIRPSGYRRVNLQVFPYYVAYVLHRQAVWVLAIAHGQRKPEYWIGRRLNLSQQDAGPNDEEREPPRLPA
jgi:plasmid stabilization system protein ParE